jgi:hypothetical protein
MDYADKLDMMDDDCDIQGFPIVQNQEELDRNIIKYEHVMANKYLVFYNCDFFGYKNNGQDDLGNASYDVYVRCVRYIHGPKNNRPISERSYMRMARAYKHDISVRRYSSEGAFFTLSENDVELLKAYHVYIWEDVVYRDGDYPSDAAEQYVKELRSQIPVREEY